LAAGTAVRCTSATVEAIQGWLQAIGLQISPWHLAVVVPVSFLVQMIPLSLNGFGLREATFSLYFARLGLPIEAALVISLLGAGLVMLFSLSGAAVYVVRGT
jgi:hypothetical protein